MCSHPLRSLRTSLTTVFLAMALTTTGQIEASPNTAEFYEPWAPGPYEVGVTTFTVDAPHRSTPIDVMLWYPAEGTSGYTPYIYNPEGKNPMRGLAVYDADIFDAGEFPAVVFSHGYGAMNFQSIFLTETLASHGYVVIAPNHPGNNIYDLKVGALWTGFFLRPMDIWSMVDELFFQESDPTSILYQRVDTSRIGMSGHSFGGYTTLAISGAQLNLHLLSQRCATRQDRSACALVKAADQVLGQKIGYVDLSDPRVIASAPLAPLAWSPFREEGLSSIRIPMQVHGGDRDHAVPAETDAAMAYAYASGPRAFVEMFDAGHFAYSDICIVAPHFTQCRPPFVDMELAHQIINTFVISHFKVFLEDDLTYAEYLTPEYAAQWSGYIAYFEDLEL